VLHDDCSEALSHLSPAISEVAALLSMTRSPSEALWRRAAEPTAVPGRLLDGPFGDEIQAGAIEAAPGRRRASPSVAALPRRATDPAPGTVARSAPFGRPALPSWAWPV
jgi:hypothetical protein